MENCTAVAEFILEGFRDQPELQLLLFVIFLMLYVTILVENSGMITIISADTHLHTPMYVFPQELFRFGPVLLLCNCTQSPGQILHPEPDHFLHRMHGPMLLFSLFITTEGFLLAVTDYDRFIAICYPLLYPIMMSRKSCHQLVAASYTCGYANGVIQTSFSFQLRFCGSSQISHSFCDVPAVMKALVPDTYVNEVVMFPLCNVIIVITTAAIFTSCAYILSTILKTRSAEGRYKAFSTCASHMTAVSLLYGMVFFIYAQPAAISTPNQSKMVSVFYTLVIPILTLLIYSLM